MMIRLRNASKLLLLTNKRKLSSLLLNDESGLLMLRKNALQTSIQSINNKSTGHSKRGNNNTTNNRQSNYNREMNNSTQRSREGNYDNQGTGGDGADISLREFLANSENLKFNKFEEEIALRRRQAQHSILVKLFTLAHVAYLIEDLETINAKIKSVYLFRSSNQLQHNDDVFALIEFDSKKYVDKVLANFSSHFDNLNHIPCKTRLLIYRSNLTNKKSHQHQHNMSIGDVISKYGHLNIFNHLNKNRNLIDLNDKLVVLENKLAFLKPFENKANEQMEEFYKRHRIDETGYRLRFFIASLIEDSFSGLFTNCVCLPFGSSINRFGQNTADLDLTMSFENQYEFVEADASLHDRQMDNRKLNGSLHFYSKQLSTTGEKENANFSLEIIEFILKNILPRFNVKDHVKGARVPILKFDFMLTQKLNCDLSFNRTNSKVTSYTMTKLLWIFSHLDARVAPLVFFVRYWAKLCKLTTHVRPSDTLTNFQLTFLVLNFLIRLERPVLVPLNDLIEPNRSKRNSYQDNQEDEDVDYVIKNVNVNELKKRLSKRGLNEKNLDDLFVDFLNFYSNFDFEKFKITLGAKAEEVPATSTRYSRGLHIQNPFVNDLNASDNVSKAQINKFIKVCDRSYHVAESLRNSNTQSFDLVKFLKIMQEDAQKIPPKRRDDYRSVADEMNMNV